MTNKTIETLVQDLKPVQPVSLIQVMILWVAVSVVFGAFYLWRVGIRHDLLFKLEEPMFGLALISYCLTFFIASYYAIAIALPGKKVLSFRNVLLLTGIKAIFSLTFYSNLLVPGAWEIAQFSTWEALGCCFRISFGALLPTMTLTFILSRMAPLELKQSVGFSWFSSAVMVSVVSQLNCPIDDPFHIWVGHGFLLFLVGVFAYIMLVPVTRLLSHRVNMSRLPEPNRQAVKAWFQA